MSCSGGSNALPPGSTVEPTNAPSASASPIAPAASAPIERLYLLDDPGVFELKGNDRTLLIARPDQWFIYDFAVSPDGTDIALAIQGPPKQTSSGYNFGVDLFVSLDGGDLKAIATHERIGETMSRPNWLPSGDKIIFAVLGRDQTGGADLHIDKIDVNTGDRQRFIDSAVEPALSPDGSQLAYVSYNDTGGEVIMIRDMATNQDRPLLPPNQIMANVANIAWAPDGTRLVFAASDPVSMMDHEGAGGGGLHIALLHPTLRDVWFANLDGTGLKRLTEIADSSLSLAWSGDNKDVYAIGDTGYWKLDTDTGVLTQLGPGNIADRVQTVFP